MDDTSHSGTTHTNNTESSNIPAPCRAGADGRAIPMSTIPRPQIIGACLAAAALLLGFAAPAPAQVQVLVSNIDQTDGVKIDLDDNNFAQGFVTGPNKWGYNLESVELNLTDLPGVSNNVKIGLLPSDTSGDNSPEEDPVGDTASLCTFVNPANLATNTGVKIFTAPAAPENCPILTPDTRYFVRLDYPSPTGAYELQKTDLDDEDPGAAAGWSIDNKYYYDPTKTGQWSLTSNTDTFEIRVNGSIIPNAIPTSLDATVTTNEDETLTFTAANFAFSDADTGDELDHVTITSLPAADTGTLSFDDTEITSVNPPQQVTPADLDASKLTYAPPDDANGSGLATFKFKVNDGAADSESESTITINVTAVNDTPVAQDDTATTNKGTAVVIAVLANDTDVDEDTLTVTQVGTQTAPINGTVVINADNATITYSPASADFTGDDTFSYTVSDGTVTVTATVTVTVTPNADLSGLTLTGVTLNEPFAAATTDYTARVAHAASRVTLTPTVDDASATMTVTVDGTPVTSESGSFDIPLRAGAVTTITVAVTNEDYTKTYTITIFRRSAAPRPPDRTRPTVTITSTAAVPVTGAFAVTIRFSESVSGFRLADIAVRNGTASDFKRGTSRTYTVTITPEASGAVRVAVGADVAEDRAGNGNRRATPLVLAADLKRPTVTIAGPAALVGLTEFAVTITFSEPVVGFEQADLQISNGRVTAFTTASPSAYRATLTPAEAGQPVVVEVPADVAQDRAGNGNQSAAFVIAADLAGPTVTIQGPAELEGLTEFAVTITFSEPVVGFEQADLQISNGRVTAFTTASPRVYRATLTLAEAGQPVVVEVSADVAEDQAGNGNQPAAFVIAAPYGRFESPADGATVSGIDLIWGWTFAEAAGVGIADIVVYIDEQHETTIPCCSLRGDVHAAYPDFPAANTTASGWGLTYNWGNLAAGAHTLQVVATSSQGVRWESAVHTIQVLKPGDVVFADRLSLAPAAVWLEDEELVLDGVVIRDKASQQEQAIAAHYGWQTAVQGLRLVATAPVEPAPVATIRAPGRAGVARLLAELGAWGRWLLSPARVTATPGLTAAYEAPADQAVVAGIGLIQGWAFADMGNELATVTLHIDGAASGPAPCCSERQDVATAYPDELGALDSGWGLVFNYGNLAAGAHTIGVRITTEAGGAETTEHTVTVVQLGGYAFVDAFDVSGAAVWIEGEEIVLSGVEVRDKATQATQLVEVRLRWSSATQGLTIVGSAPMP